MSVTTEAKHQYILTASCPAAHRQVSTISSFVADRGGYIMELNQFDDTEAGNFFIRLVFRRDPQGSPSIETIRKEFEPIAAEFRMHHWGIHDTTRHPRVLIMVSKFDHCLEDLLYRKRMGELHMEIPAIVSNHPDLAPIAERNGIPYIHLPVSADTKAQQEARLLEIIEETRTDLVVLARYMQVMSDTMCERLAGRAINIHHSFLPGFKGAKPYHQAHVRGVKLIGATAHYVTADLDEGPIIEQVVERVDHTYHAEHLVAAGRDSECMALARAVHYHITHRVFINGHKTVVFR